MSLSKIAQESAESFKQETLPKLAKELNLREETVSGVDEIGVVHNAIYPILISSQISLLEAELARKKGMMKIELPTDDMYNGVENGKYQIISKDIIYLQEQIEKCKKLLTNQPNTTYEN
jgi:hypothetical protein